MPLTVGVPKELKVGERRVSLTPNGVVRLTQKGIPVLVEKDAGILSSFKNSEYEKAGGVLVQTREEVWKKADLIKKVKEPIPEEFSLFEPRHMIFTYLHLASPTERTLVEALIKAKVTAIGYETIEKDGATPLLRPMSEIAGVLSAYYAGLFRKYVRVGGVKILGLEEVKPLMVQLASAYPQVPQGFNVGTAVILGGGYVGENAARTIASMGGEVFISEISESKRENLTKTFKAQGLKVQLINPQEKKSYEEILESSDIIIAAVHAVGKRAPIVIDRDLLEKTSRRRKKIILDVAIDQGGNVDASHPTDYENPLYLDDFGNLRFSVTNIPSLCGRGAAEALERVSLDYTVALAEGLDQALTKYPELRSGVNVLRGDIIHPAVREVHRF